MGHPTDVKVKDAAVTFWPAPFRTPLKFGRAELTSLYCARARVAVEDGQGRAAVGYGETPLSVGWAWPDNAIPHEERENRMLACCVSLAAQWRAFPERGHPMEIGHAFGENVASDLPLLAELVCNSAFDLALHDAYGALHGVSTYATYHAEYMNRDLASYFGDDRFAGKFPGDYLEKTPPETLPVWHLVGGLDRLTDANRTGDEPDDGYPVTLEDWIRADGLTCLKIKLTGVDRDADARRLLAVGEVARNFGADRLSPDFNGTVEDAKYVLDTLADVRAAAPDTFENILYVEQPFPYDLDAFPIDARPVAAVKPVFLDESAHDWQHVRRGRELGWNGVALKVCKTQTGALLSACWARAHGMQLMVQDLTNPALALIPHVNLAAHVGTIGGVECNAAQFYPTVSESFEARHPGLYRRRAGVVDRRTLDGPGLGYGEGDRAEAERSFR